MSPLIIVQDWYKVLDVEQVEHMAWPAKSPDLNPKVYLWDALGHKLGEINPQPGNLQHLWNALLNCCDTIEGHTLVTLVDGVPRQVEAVMHAQGSHTQYWKCKYAKDTEN